ncbi:MAG: DinB family protein [Candidatus Solibacter usitatus]|nr:DinB family protein [Candidatus Solibacter usitatus]
MIGSLANQLRQAVEQEHAALLSLSDAMSAAQQPQPEGWSPKEELGHLIDSAANNHQRFVRAALEADYRGPGYAQDDWVRLHGYAALPWAELVEFWYRYNLLLAHLVARIPEEKSGTSCTVGAGAPVTLGFLIDDYILHMRHHLDHLLGREVVTQYPRR